MKRIALCSIFALISTYCLAQINNSELNRIVHQTTLKTIESIVKGQKNVVAVPLVKDTTSKKNNTVIPDYAELIKSLNDINQIKEHKRKMDAEIERLKRSIEEIEMAMPKLSFDSVGLDTSAIAVRSKLIEKGFQYVEENEKSYVFRGQAFGADSAVIGVKKTVDPTDMKIMIRTSNSWADAKAEYERVRGLLIEQYGGFQSNEVLPEGFVDYQGAGDVGFVDGTAKYESCFLARKGLVSLYLDYKSIAQEFVVCIYFCHYKPRNSKN